ncbi:AMP-dependent synthetase [Agromyces badenianii]|uniref:AMP-dependent synthetase n=1 Tax=Agromyces badenianii TaxID=2080742 RepID=A0A2S0WSM6_9MICO|nr:AMP-binding protein [Agromyces badenianii]AWB94327.1 AMP-dependent synthetase [Agromyces badenianii]
MSARSSETTRLRLLRGRASDDALVVGGVPLTYGEIQARVDARRDELGSTRRLVMIEGGNALEPVVTYLAALEGGHVVLFVDGDPARSAEHRRGLIERFDPDIVATGPNGAGTAASVAPWHLDERREGTRHELHPELAMLASTSGSTGSPKLVRLSRENVVSNAIAIGDSLQLGPSDRAITTLPLHYCYGLSVVNSHLVSGAGVALTERSVVDDGFWNEFTASAATSFAGVPYTFELLEATGFAGRHLPNLRYITQAGGRLDPERVRRFARLGRERHFDFIVMYGQTEATARMAYLPPHLAEASAGAIGIPIPGGRFTIDAPAGEDVGELVYGGPNVMMGYAEQPADFALGREIEELRTGDLARVRDDGLYEIVGRNNRFAKIFGLRLDLDRVERLLADEGSSHAGGHEVRAASCDERLLLFVLAERFAGPVRDRAVALFGLPAHAIRVHAVAEFPRTSSGKPDTGALLRHAALAEQHEQHSAPGGVAGATGTDARRTPLDVILALYAEVLGRPDATPEDSFAGLGGDSLSYVEVSLRLEQLVGELPRGWPSLSVGKLADVAAGAAAAGAGATVAPGATGAGATGSRSLDAPRRRRRMPRIETPALLRAIAIVLIVGTHANLFFVQGGAHLLLAVAGYNLARFQLADAPGRRRVAGLLKSTAQVVVPAALWIGAVGLVTGGYRPTTALFVNNFLGDESWNRQWQFWFLEAIVWTMVALAAVFAVPRVDRLERRHPFAFALGVLGVALAARLLLTGGVEAEGIPAYMTLGVVWCIALGWLVARSSTLAQRLTASALTLVTVPGFFGEPGREAIVVAGVLVLLWLPAVPVPRLLVPVIGLLAGASMFIYLTHWQVYPPLEYHVPWLATLLSLVIGVLVWKAYSFVVARGAAVLARRRRR